MLLLAVPAIWLR